MGVRTYLHLIPKAAPNWMPDNEFVRELLVGYFQARHVWSVTIYDKPLYWNGEEDEGVVPVEGTDVISVIVASPVLVREEHGLDIEKALGLLADTRGICKVTNFDPSEWGNRVWQELSTLPGSIIDEAFCTCDPSLYLGPSSLPDRSCGRTAACVNCRLSFMGIGGPKDWDQYFQIVTNNKSFVSLKTFVEDRSGLEWRFLMSGSW